MKKMLMLAIIAVWLLNAQLSWAELLVFGPQIFTRGPGEPQKIIKTFSVKNPSEKFTISVQSVRREPGKISNALIELNGAPVIGPNEFKKEAVTITKPVKLQKENKIAVAVRSEPGTWVAVSILGSEGPSVKGMIGSQGGRINLKGFASVIFPPGAFTNSTPVSVSVTTSPETDNDFTVTAEGPRLPYEIRINSGKVAAAMSFDVVLDVPDSLIATLPPDTPQIEIFAQILEDEGAEQSLHHFHGFPSTFDAVTKKVNTTLPMYAFTNRRQLDLTYDAIITVGAIPTVPTKGSRQDPYCSPKGWPYR